MSSALGRELLALPTYFFKFPQLAQVVHNGVCNHNFQVCTAPATAQISCFCWEFHSVTVLFEFLLHFLCGDLFQLLALYVFPRQLALAYFPGVRVHPLNRLTCADPVKFSKKSIYPPG